MTQSGRTIDIASLIDSRKMSGFNYKLIILSWLITFFDGFDMMLISYTAPYIREEFGLTRPELGNVFSAGLIGMMIGGFLFSYIGDRIGRRSTIIVCAFLFGILTFAMGLAKSYEALVLIRFLDGMAIGGMLPLAWALNTEYVPKRARSTIVTIIMVGFSLGVSMGAPVTVWLAPHIGWHGVYFCAGAATTLVAALLLWGLPESVRFLASKQLKPHLIASTLNKLDPSLKATAQDNFDLGDEKVDTENFKVSKLFIGDLKWITPLIWIGYIMSSMAVYFEGSWAPLIYEDLKFSRETSAYVSSVSNVGSAILGLLLMRFTDRYGPLMVAILPLICTPLLIIVGLVEMTPTMFLWTVGIATAILSGAHFGILSIASIYYPSAIRANGGGWATSVAKIGGIAGPIVGGTLLSSGMPIIQSFAVLAICPIVLTLCAFGIAAIVCKREGSEQVAKAGTA